MTTARYRGQFGLAVLLSCGSVEPALAANCQPVAAARLETQAEALKRSGEAIMLIGKAAQDYLDVVNSTPPVTHLAGSGVMLLVIAQGAVIGIIQGDRVCIVGHIGIDVHKLALAAAQGEPI